MSNTDPLFTPHRPQPLSSQTASFVEPLFPINATALRNLRILRVICTIYFENYPSFSIDTMAEWSKAVDLSLAKISTTEMCVGSNPTRVNLLLFCNPIPSLCSEREGLTFWIVVLVVGWCKE